MAEQALIIDGIKWHIPIHAASYVQPLCPKHHLRLTLSYNASNSCFLSCADCADKYHLPREFTHEKQYVIDKIDSKSFKQMKFINLDDEAIPIAGSKVSSSDNKYFTTALLTQSKVGLRLVVYAGERGNSNKTQIFVEPEIKRLAFDQKDIHPSDVFIELKGTFADGTSASIHGANT